MNISIKHFDERFLMRAFEYVGSDGKQQSVPRPFPKLTLDAYPTIFPDLPSYLTTNLPPQRKTPDQRRVEMDEREESFLEDFLAQDCISDYDTFVWEIREKLQRLDEDKAWNITVNNKVIYIFTFDYSQTFLRIHS
jgi:hypothetical protein